MITSTSSKPQTESASRSDNRMSKKNSAKKSTKSKSDNGSPKTKSSRRKAAADDSFSAGDALIENNPNLKNTLQQIEKEFGEGSIMPLGAAQQGRIKGISTGCLSLDLALLAIPMFKNAVFLGLYALLSRVPT